MHRIIEWFLSSMKVDNPIRKNQMPLWKKTLISASDAFTLP